MNTYPLYVTVVGEYQTAPNNSPPDNQLFQRPYSFFSSSWYSLLSFFQSSLLNILFPLCSLAHCGRPCISGSFTPGARDGPKRHLSNETTGGSPEVISINSFPSSKSLHQTSPPCLWFSFPILSFAPRYPQFLFLFCPFGCFCWRCLLGWMRSFSGLDSKYGSSSH